MMSNAAATSAPAKSEGFRPVDSCEFPLLAAAWDGQVFPGVAWELWELEARREPEGRIVFRIVLPLVPRVMINGCGPTEVQAAINLGVVAQMARRVIEESNDRHRKEKFPR